LSNSIISIFSENQENLSSKLLQLSSRPIIAAGHAASSFAFIQSNNAKVKKGSYVLPDVNKFQRHDIFRNNKTVMLLIASPSSVLLFFIKWKKINLGRLLHLTCFIYFYH
jgi:hypothetical protein